VNRAAWQRWRAALPPLFTERVSRDPDETAEAARRRRRVVAGTSLAGAGLLGLSLSTRPGSQAFYGLTLGTAATWTVGSLASGRLHRGQMPPGHRLRRPTVVPILTGAGAFGVFYGCALVCRRIPVLDQAIGSVLRYAEHGSGPLVLATTLANGAAEEVFFRGALYSAIDSGAIDIGRIASGSIFSGPTGRPRPVLTSTAVYMLATVATRNPALVLASAAMGTLFGLQRRASGGIQAPLLTHLTWSTLMLRYLPPLFRSTVRRMDRQPGVSTKVWSPASNRSTSESST
jgi:membrane protease YdiL (CAAX protease family)